MTNNEKDKFYTIKRIIATMCSESSICIFLNIDGSYSALDIGYKVTWSKDFNRIIIESTRNERYTPVEDFRKCHDQLKFFYKQQAKKVSREISRNVVHNQE